MTLDCGEASFIEGKTLPLWVANFILMDSRTAPSSAAPAHDQRKFDFARNMASRSRPSCSRPAQIPASSRKSETSPPTARARSFTPISSDGLGTDVAFDEVADRLRGARDLDGSPMGARKVNFRLRDWLISRQRGYWGCLIPMIYQTTAARFPCLPPICRFCCPTTPPSDKLATCLTTSPDLETRRLSEVASRPGARPTPWTPSWIRPGTTRALQLTPEH